MATYDEILRRAGFTTGPQPSQAAKGRLARLREGFPTSAGSLPANARGEPAEPPGPDYAARLKAWAKAIVDGADPARPVIDQTAEGVREKQRQAKAADSSDYN